MLNQPYDHLWLYTNFFQPVMKLKEKTRSGSRVKKTYDRERTPFCRIVESGFVPKQAKKALREEYALLNPVKLKREIIRLQDTLDALARSRNRAKRQEQHANLECIST